jgi:5-methylcytosine-specific restriction endonuclease McrA
MGKDSIFVKFVLLKPSRDLRHEPVAHLILGKFDNYPASSWASAQLLRKELAKEDTENFIQTYHRGSARQWEKFKKKTFKSELKEKGILTCYHCERSPLRTGAQSCFQIWRATLDHIIPLSLGGARCDKNNVVVSCAACNSRRGSQDFHAFVSPFKVKKKEPVEIPKVA